MPLVVVSLNCWGVPVVAKNRRERMEAIAQYLLESSLTIDAVAVQEIWSGADYALLCDLLYPAFSYPYYFRSGVIGSGLAVFSRHPIVDVALHRYSVNGKPQRIFHGDYLGGKAIGLCRIRHPEGLVDLYNTHLIARYALDAANDEYAAHRVAQCWEVMRFVRQTARNHVVVVGDFNMDSEMLGYRVLTSPVETIGGGGLVDSFVETTTDVSMTALMKQELRKEIGLVDDAMTSPASLAPSAQRSDSKDAIYTDCVQGNTCAAPSNSYTPPNNPFRPERIDFVYYLPTPTFRCDYTRLALVNRVPKIGCSYSDHYGLLSVFTVSERQRDNEDSGMDLAPLSVNINMKSSGDNTDSRPVSPTIKHPLTSFSVDEMDISKLPNAYRNVSDVELLPAVIKLLTWGIRDARSRRHYHNAIFYTFSALLLITLVTIITLASVSWDGISQALLRSVWVLSLVLAIVSTVFWCYEGITLLYIMPEEVSALERVRSEIVVWVRGCYFAAFSGDITTTKRSLPTAYEERGVLDAAVIRTVFKLAGLPSEDIHVAPPVVPSVAKVPPSALPPRVLAHARRTSNMANPGPQHDQDMLAINAIAGVLRSGSSDHRGGIVTDAVDGALNEIRTTTQRIGEMVERQMPANLTMPRSRAASTTAGESIAPSSTRTQSNAASLKSRHSTAQ